MKTAEEWATEIDEPIDNQLIPLIKQIQLDAWKQGMTDAAKVITSKPHVSIMMGSFTGYRAIIHARDNTNELPHPNAT